MAREYCIVVREYCSVAREHCSPPSPQGTVLRSSPRPQVQAGPPTARCWPCGAGAKPRWPWPCDQSSLQHAHVDMRRPRSRRHQPPVCRPARSSSSSEGGWFTRFREARLLVTRNKISRYKKQEKLVWCVVEEGPSLHTHTNGRTVSPQFLPFKELGTHVSESRMRAPPAPCCS